VRKTFYKAFICTVIYISYAGNVERICVFPQNLLKTNGEFHAVIYNQMKMEFA